MKMLVTNSNEVHFANMVGSRSFIVIVGQHLKLPPPLNEVIHVIKWTQSSLFVFAHCN